MVMRVVVTHEKCVAAGQCVRAAPSVFAQSDDDGTVMLLVEQPDASTVEAVQKAVGWCPSGAIRLRNE